MNIYAGFWKRIGAFALDYVVILLYLLVLTLAGLILNSAGLIQQLFADRVRAQLIGFLSLTLPVSLYFAISEASAGRATWGKKRLGLQVTGDAGEQISIWRSLARTALKFLPWELAHTAIWEFALSSGRTPLWANYALILVYMLVGLNLVSLAITKKHQTIYDRIAHTFVLKQTQ